MITQAKHYTIDEFAQRYSENPFEFIDGEEIPISPQTARSGRVGGRLFLHLSNHVFEHQLGEVFIEVPFVLTETVTADWVTGARVPDVTFVSKARIDQLVQARPNWEDGPLTLIPDLVVEIVSPTDRFSKVSEKVARYLRDGMKLIWVLDPQQRTVTIYAAGSNQQTILSGGDIPTGADVISGFEIRVEQFLKG
jgi:Uma2 family endonuclease